MFLWPYQTSQTNALHLRTLFSSSQYDEEENEYLRYYYEKPSSVIGDMNHIKHLEWTAFTILISRLIDLIFKLFLYCRPWFAFLTLAVL